MANIARGAHGVGLVRGLYQRSPLRGFVRGPLAHRGVRPDDFILASYPRSGSAWLRFLMLELITGQATFAKVVSEMPRIGRHRQARGVLPGGHRLVAVHERYAPRYRQAILLVRDPRDSVISYFHHMQRLRRVVMAPGDDAAASFDAFVTAFICGRVDGHGTWLQHLVSWWAAADAGRVELFRLRYEDLHADAPGELKRLAAFLGIEADEERCRAAAEGASFERMRAAEEVEQSAPDTIFKARELETGVPLVRRGKAGGWQTELTDSQKARFEAFSDGLELMGYPLP